MRTSVVVPAYDAWETLPRTLDALESQVDRTDRELILVESSGTSTPEELERRWPWIRAVTPGTRAFPAQARNIGVEQARGELIAFTDADTIPDPDWLDELERALRPGADAVAGTVVNGTPTSALGTSDYLLEFGAWVPGRQGQPLHGATCNLLVRLEVLQRHGGFPTHAWPGEDTLFTFPLGESGKLAFAPAARITHLNRTRVADVVRHQYVLGRGFAQVCREIRFPHRVFAWLPLAPVAGLLRVLVLSFRLARWRVLPRGGSALVPLMFAIACVWSAGFTVGGVRSALRRAGGRDRRRPVSRM